MSSPTFSSSSTADDVASAFSNEIAGKNVLITGTSKNGIGFETALAIAKHGANLVIITGYNDQRLKESENAIKAQVPTANIRRLVLDLASLSAVRTAADEVNSYSEPIHVLIHNAAAAISPFKLTVDNLETQMATAHIGPFLFTKLILPKVLASASPSPSPYTPRVVFVSSMAIRSGSGSGVNFETIAKPDAATYDAMDAYSQAKCANVMTALELCKRARGRVNAYSLHPGVIFTNMIQKEESRELAQASGLMNADGKPNTTGGVEWKTLAQGAATTVTAAFDPRLNDKPGAFLSDCAVNDEIVPAHCTDPGNRAKLWEVTEGIVGEKFVF
ncbi:short-chain dehydrogenase/reductase family protein [Favolaschia claudopus]|uniref:Short-chain dehydrogenase/reductase family protein n=1 Tax=Favolaschia claudopus TaxID=2862362 RepID=A0AAV9ZM92_9AGAR